MCERTRKKARARQIVDETKLVDNSRWQPKRTHQRPRPRAAWSGGEAASRLLSRARRVREVTDPNGRQHEVRAGSAGCVRRPRVSSRTRPYFWPPIAKARLRHETGLSR